VQGAKWRPCTASGTPAGFRWAHQHGGDGLARAFGGQQAGQQQRGVGAGGGQHGFGYVLRIEINQQFGGDLVRCAGQHRVFQRRHGGGEQILPGLLGGRQGGWRDAGRGAGTETDHVGLRPGHAEVAILRGRRIEREAVITALHQQGLGWRSKVPEPRNELQRRQIGRLGGIVWGALGQHAPTCGQLRQWRDRAGQPGKNGACRVFHGGGALPRRQQIQETAGGARGQQFAGGFRQARNAAHPGGLQPVADQRQRARTFGNGMV
jgi:hypothetical protein